MILYMIEYSIGVNNNRIFISPNLRLIMRDFESGIRDDKYYLGMIQVKDDKIAKNLQKYPDGYTSNREDFLELL